ncbi:MAG: metallophosphoesterase [Thermofilaceae archaeon]|nr:metallophosphoesterase [Thermofilaceae archaeon]MCX8180682.1 metallophosphoesterase [Thermofilaceae archaeon]MDW8003786.1 metallophosphoesterase [Thermofilaceae archaeon]
MGRIGLVSDSHDNLEAVDKALIELEKRGIKLIIHAGDIIAPFTLRRILKRGFELRGVFGNNDGELLLLTRVAREASATLSPQPLITEIEGLRILVMHGTSDLSETKFFATKVAESGAFDVVVYGHTHEVDVRSVNRVLIINPGELCGYLTGRRTFAILDTEKRELEIIEV